MRSLSLSDCPQGLLPWRDKAQWVGFQMVKDGGGYRKPPVNPKTGEYADVNCPDTWGTYDEAVKAVSKYKLDGIGIILTDGLIGVDLDHVLKDGKLDPDAQDIVNTLCTYTEISPSGSGLHLLMRGTEKTYEMLSSFKTRGKFEIYRKDRYLTVTGDLYGGNYSGISSNDVSLQAVLRKYWPIITTGGTTESDTPDTPKLTDEELLDDIRRSQSGDKFRAYYYDGKYTDHSRADLGLCNILMFFSFHNMQQVDRLFRKSKLMRDKWDEKRSNTTYGELTLKKSYDQVKRRKSRDDDMFDDGFDEWDEPVPFNDVILPDFPIDALPPVIADYVQAVADYTQAPVDMAAMCALAVIATAAQGKFRACLPNGHTEPLNLYCLCIMPPAERKSAVFRQMKKPVDEYEAEYNRENKAEIEKSKASKDVLERRRERIKGELAKSDNEADINKKQAELEDVCTEIANFSMKKQMRLFTEDATPEATAVLMADNNERITVASTEGTILDTLAGTYSKNPNLGIFLNGWSGDTCQVDRMGREPVRIENPKLSMLIMAQPDVLAGVIQNKRFSGRGLTGRFLYSLPKSRIGTRDFNGPAIPEDVYDNYRNRIVNMLNEDCKFVTDLHFQPEAEQAARAWHNELEPKIETEYRDLRDWTGKAEGETWRIAGLLCRASTDCIFEDSNDLTISKEHVESAVKIIRYCIEHAKAAYNLMGMDETENLSKRVLSVIKELKKPEFVPRDVYKPMHLATARIQPALDLLTEYGYIRPCETSKTGKPKKYQLNPLI